MKKFTGVATELHTRNKFNVEEEWGEIQASDPGSTLWGGWIKDTATGHGIPVNRYELMLSNGKKVTIQIRPKANCEGSGFEAYGPFPQ